MGSFQVEVWWDGQTIPGVTGVTPLRDTVDVVTYREVNGGVYKIPGREDVANVTLSRGVSEDLSFDLWARGPLLKKDIELRLLDTSDGLQVAYRLYRCWVSEYAVAADAETGVATESLSLSVNHWERVTLPVDQLADGLARERAGEVRRVPLASILAGDADETQKRLDVLLAEAERSHTVLLFDEADALFSRRTDVQDAHDRYQKTELDLVLDRLAGTTAAVVVVVPPREG
ncbi:MAG: phage tail protein [Actinomycetota bacterium]|nr:phage tail protein [Actinomycetota bacterium]